MLFTYRYSNACLFSVTLLTLVVAFLKETLRGDGVYRHGLIFKLGSLDDETDESSDWLLQDSDDLDRLASKKVGDYIVDLFLPTKTR